MQWWLHRRVKQIWYGTRAHVVAEITNMAVDCSAEGHMKLCASCEVQPRLHIGMCRSLVRSRQVDKRLDWLQQGQS